MNVLENKIESFFISTSRKETEGLSVYMIGIGGIGMSALARYFNSRGVRVSGYDRTETSLTIQLTAEGMEIHYEDNVNLIDKDASVVVYTPAIPGDHRELNHYLEHGYPVLKRSEVLGWITENSYNICVAGTHGKTTTSTMIAHILRHSGYGCNAFLGGIATNYNSNFWSSDQNICVIEADEYDRSFLKLTPDVAVITAMDPDHLDIYGDRQSFEEAFIIFSKKIKDGGKLFVKYGIHQPLAKSTEHWGTYSLQQSEANIYASDIQVIDGAYHFHIQMDGYLVKDVELHMGGLHNIENALVSFAVASHLGVEEDKIKKALSDFRGVKRRFEYVLNNEKHILIDDYAHHPQELEALIGSVKQLYPQKRCLIVFQPHLFSRTHDFADGFAHALEKADEVWLLPIYPAREKPMPGVTSEMIANLMSPGKATCMSKEQLLERSKKMEGCELMIMAGAGDIDTLIESVKNNMN